MSCEPCWSLTPFEVAANAVLDEIFRNKKDDGHSPSFHAKNGEVTRPIISLYSRERGEQSTRIVKGISRSRSTIGSAIDKTTCTLRSDRLPHLLNDESFILPSIQSLVSIEKSFHFLQELILHL